jgi:membrane-bound inhibitor of C-type lysozyme
MEKLLAIGIAIGTAAGLLAGCMATGHDAAVPTTTARHVVFLCERGQTISVDFSEGQALLEANGVSAQLAQQPSGSGIHYAGGGHDLRGKGWDMTWTDSAGAVHQCRDQQGFVPSGARSMQNRARTLTRADQR